MLKHGQIDWAEDRSELSSERERLYELIERTPWLDWLMLTKRVEHIAAIVPWGNQWPNNVWLGTTVENQKYADLRIPMLLDLPAKIHFLSCEPLLGNIDISSWADGIDWIIAGGESGPKSRPMLPEWPRGLRDQCLSHDVAFHFKQWGNWFPVESHTEIKQRTKIIGDVVMANLGKKKAGRFLDGQVWNGLPVSA